MDMNNGKHESLIMSGLQLVKYPLCDILFGCEQVGFMLAEEGEMLRPKLTYETD